MSERRMHSCFYTGSLNHKAHKIFDSHKNLEP